MLKRDLIIQLREVSNREYSLESKVSELKKDNEELRKSLKEKEYFIEKIIDAERLWLRSVIESSFKKGGEEKHGQSGTGL